MILIKVKGQIYARQKFIPHLQKITAKYNFDRPNNKGEKGDDTAVAVVAICKLGLKTLSIPFSRDA